MIRMSILLQQKSNSIGFIQGRLSPLVENKIQAFPAKHWQDEFRIASEYGFTSMEWTLDHDGLYENPLMLESGRRKIIALIQHYRLNIPSLTADFVMQKPFYKLGSKTKLLQDLMSVISAASKVGVKFVVVPLVDNGSLESESQVYALHEGLQIVSPLLSESGVKLIFESDYPPAALSAFIDPLPAALFGINYDIGNSAALGFDPEEEIYAYGHRIDNVHVKDRILLGTTVPLGTGNADFELVFSLLGKVSYSGNYILQTARACDGHHVQTLCRYRDMTLEWLSTEKNDQAILSEV